MRTSILRVVLVAGVAALPGCAARHPAATAPPSAAGAAGGSGGAAAALGPAALAAWWDAHHVALPPAPLVTHDDVVAAAARAVDADAGRVAREVVGRSVEGRDLLHLTVGRGPTHVLLWSQMHGDEPSATPAIFDLLEWIRRERGTAAVQRLEDRLTVHLVPMLNPDGAQRYTRRNAQGIDINRDALHLQTPEGRALKALRDRLQPVLGFNLHNQNGQTSAGSPPKPATISLLAVAHDAARSDSPRRTLAKQTAALVREALEPLIPGQVGRYSDEFEVRAFGDNLGRWGTAVVLIESGPLSGADADRALVRLNFVALVTALDGLASGRTAAHPTAAYDTLPVNESNLLSIRIRNATIAAGHRRRAVRRRHRREHLASARARRWAPAPPGGVAHRRSRRPAGLRRARGHRRDRPDRDARLRRRRPRRRSGADARLVGVAGRDDRGRPARGAVPARAGVAQARRPASATASPLSESWRLVRRIQPGGATPLGIPVPSGFCLPIDDLPRRCAAVRNDRAAGRCTRAFVPSREID